MDEQTAIEIIQKLRSQQIEKLEINKEDFLMFRSILVQQEDFKHFRGVAQRGGAVEYYYVDEPRS